MQQEHVSRSAAQSLIAGGHVRVNDRPAKSGQRVRAEDDVVVVIPPPAVASAETAGPHVPLVVVYEDDALAVIDKPAGLVVHHAVPSALSTRRENVLAFERAWDRWVSPGAHALSARDPRAAAVLELHRGDDPFGIETQMRTLWY